LIVATTPFAGAPTPEVPGVTEFNIEEDGSGHLLYSNGTKLQFYHNFMYPAYLYGNGTIYDNADNGSEVLESNDKEKK
jgi:hypothetical protein